MRFQSGSKLRYLKVTVPFSATGPNKTAPFRLTYSTPEGEIKHLERNQLLKFRFEEDGGHVFDTQAGQKKHGWTDTERYIVEQHLLDPRNGYFKRGDGRGIFSLDEADKVQEVLAAQAAPKCEALEVHDGQLVKCEEPAVRDRKCERHAAEVAAPSASI